MIASEYHTTRPAIMPEYTMSTTEMENTESSEENTTIEDDGDTQPEPLLSLYTFRGNPILLNEVFVKMAWITFPLSGLFVSVERRVDLFEDHVANMIWLGLAVSPIIFFILSIIIVWYRESKTPRAQTNPHQ